MTYRYSVDFAEKKIVTIPAVQYDAYSRNITLDLFSKGEEFAPPAGSLFAVNYQKPDGTSGSYDTLPNEDDAVLWDNASPQITVALAPQMLTVAGRVKANVQIYSDAGMILQTFAFWVVVEAAPHRFGEPSEDYYNLRSLADVQAAIGDLTELETDETDELVGAINAVNAAAKAAVKKVNNKTPAAATGNVDIAADDIPAQVTALDNWSGTVDEALEILASYGKVRFIDENLSTTIGGVVQLQDETLYPAYGLADGDYLLGKNGAVAVVSALSKTSDSIYQADATTVAVMSLSVAGSSIGNGGGSVSIGNGGIVEVTGNGGGNITVGGNAVELEGNISVVSGSISAGGLRVQDVATPTAAADAATKGYIDTLAASFAASVKQFGAKGDGAADDAAAIQSALDVCKTSGGVIYFPVGIYKITAALKFYSNQTLLFAPGATILQGAADMDNLMRNDAHGQIGGYGETQNVRIIGATFDGGDVGTENETLLAFCHSENIEIVGCTFRNRFGGYHNVEINSSRHVRVAHCRFYGERASGATAEHLQVDSLMAGNQGAYPWLDDEGVYEGKADDTNCDDILVEHCWFDGSTPGFGHHNTKAGTMPTRLRIIGCVFDASVYYGEQPTQRAIGLQTASEVEVAGCQFNGYTYAMHFNRKISKVRIHDNTILGTAGSAGTAIWAVGSATASEDDVDIYDNTIDSFAKGVLIQHDESGSCQAYNNRLTDISETAIEIVGNGATPPAAGIIRDNVINGTFYASGIA